MIAQFKHSLTEALRAPLTLDHPPTTLKGIYTQPHLTHDLYRQQAQAAN
jgi:hypothetical protein